MKTVLSFLTTLFLLTFNTSAQTYVIDPGHSSVQVKVQRFGGVYVVGRFKKVEGEITFPESKVEQLQAKALIDANSYDANNEKGEASIKSKAFLDVANYPTLSFVSERVEQRSDGNYLIGNLTVHGVTKGVAIPFKLMGPTMDFAARKPSIAMNGKLKINRQDYGMKFNKQTADGTKFVGDEVEISLMIHAIKKSD
ncbi:MAG: YceI family protein [Vicingaceae bacterium]